MTITTTQELSVLQCATCGVERDADQATSACQLCADERQYLSPDGMQRWLDPHEPIPGAHFTLAEVEPGLHTITQHNCPGISQVPLLVDTVHRAHRPGRCGDD